MDKEFIALWESVSEWKAQADKSELADNAISFHEEEDGLVRIRGDKGEAVYRLKPLSELFAPEYTAPAVMKWDDPRYLSLLHVIESAVKHHYMADRELTDASVMLALDQLAMKPERLPNDEVVKSINQELRLALSLDGYSREEVKKAARKILASVKRHKAAAGVRGYLNFVLEHVP